MNILQQNRIRRAERYLDYVRYIHEQADRERRYEERYGTKFKKYHLTASGAITDLRQPATDEIQKVRTPDVSEVDTALLSPHLTFDVSKLNTSIIPAVVSPTTESIPRIPKTTTPLVDVDDQHEYRMTEILPPVQHLENAVMPFWENRLSGKHAIPERMLLSPLYMQFACIANVLVEIEMENEKPAYMFFFKDFIIPVEANHQPDDLIICIGKK
jgi:hypothetical protein